MKKLVVLSGAGISAESGIPTFRDAGGLWDNYRIEEVATPEGFIANPQLVLDFYNNMRKKLVLSEPNYGHVGLVELEQKYEVCIVTQNIDDLHERAGSSKVIHLHGELLNVRSSRNPEMITVLPSYDSEIHLGDKAEDGSQLRPDIVWFGEAVPNMDQAILEASQADLFLIIGTSLNVYPAAGLLNYVPQNVPVYVIDPKQVPLPSNRQVTMIQKGASEGMKEFIQMV